MSGREGKSTESDSKAAAETIQRVYRGYHERRCLRGLSLDPASRWSEAIKDAQYRQLTSLPLYRRQSKEEAEPSSARSAWLRAASVAKHAVEDADTAEDNAAAAIHHGVSPKTLDLRYFLEMVDPQHRYGSNLSKYHAEWLSRPTTDNFFAWLDGPEGRQLDVPKCSRRRLDAMKVRYLSREERLAYKVIVGEKGKLVWRKNGQPVDTTADYRDSIEGIVLADDPAPVWASGFSQGWSSCSGSEADPVQMSHEEQGNKKQRKKQKWIFVADAHNNLYIGIKQSGAFQHSSFLHGSRIFVAGLINVRHGQLKLLQPRSGHYRTPSSNLREFIHSLQHQGVDMSHSAVGSSYAAMWGTDGFMKARGTWQQLKKGVKDLTI